MTVLGIFAIGMLTAIIAVCVAHVLFRLPSLENRRASSVTAPSAEGALSGPVSDLVYQYPGKSGVYALQDGLDAFAARGLFADAAAATIDAQYYIWHKDLTGLLLLKSLRDAAERGVTVRLLVDDNGIDGLDPILSELDAHPNIEVRLYNPFMLRRLKAACYLFDFIRLNRRMHNKSFTIDGRVTIVGGRNIGDEYFGTGAAPIFIDLDVLAIGEVVGSVSMNFEAYWSSASAYPIEMIVSGASGGGAALDNALAASKRSEQYSTYKQSLSDAELIADLKAGKLELEWTTVRMVSDSPLKTLRKAMSEELLIGQIDELMDDVSRSLDVVSPYFVPGKRGIAEFATLKRKGAAVRILTNSMSANDVKLVHSGYAKYRRRLLEAGVELFELKAEHSPQDSRRDAGFAGSSGSSLHAKTFATDERHIYIGSFNFDPRSTQLNTEMGFLIESEAMASQLKQGFDQTLENIAYRLELTDSGRIQWSERDPVEAARTYSTDPETGLLERLMVRLVGYLPIQWML